MGGFGVTNYLATGFSINFSPSHKGVEEGTSLVNLKVRQWRHGSPCSQYSFREAEVVCCGCATAETTIVLNLKTKGKLQFSLSGMEASHLSHRKLNFSLILARQNGRKSLFQLDSCQSRCLLFCCCFYFSSLLTADNLLSLEVHSSIHLKYFITGNRFLMLF